MTNSMTGYAEQTIHRAWGSLSCQIRSVNHRYLELHFRLPEIFYPLEAQLRELARQNLHRGKVDCLIQLVQQPNSSSEFSLNVPLVEKLVNSVQHLSSFYPASYPVSTIPPLELLKWPGVLQERSLGIDELSKDLNAIFIKSVQQLQQFRQREGQQLNMVMQGRLTEIQDQLHVIQQRLPEIKTQYKSRLLSRLQELKVEYDTHRFEQELLYWVQKTDVAEEIERLQTHLQALDQLLQQSGAIGRRVDFLVQELNREANTLAAKSNDGLLTQATINLKVLIEQIREQAQNLE